MFRKSDSRIDNKILFIQFYFYPDISSVSQLLEELVFKLSNRKDLEITVLCSQSHSEKRHRWYPESLKENHSLLQRKNVKIKHLHSIRSSKRSNLLRIMDFLWFSVQVTVFLVLYSYRWNTIVSLTTPPFIGVFTSLGLILNKKSKHFHYIQDLYPDLLYDLGYLPYALLFRIMRKFTALNLHRSNGVITIGKKMAEKLRDQYLLEERKIKVIENWDSKIVYKKIKKNKTFSIVYSGNCGAAHDFGPFLLLVEELRSFRGIQYLFYGGGNRYSQLQKSFSLLGEKRVQFNGYAPKDKVSDNIANADILVIAQKRKTVGDILPSKIYSYLRAGRPLLFIGPRSSEIGELILKNDIGFILENNTSDIEPALQYIEFLMKNPDNAKIIGQRAKELYEATMGLDRVAKQFLTLVSA